SVVELAMGKAKHSRGEFIGNARIDGGVVAGVSGQSVGPQERGQPFGVRDLLQFGDNGAASFLVKLLVVPSRMVGLKHSGDTVVLADEESLHGGQFDILIGAHVSRREKLI